MILRPDQQTLLDEITRSGRRLAKAKREARSATEAVKVEVFAALDAGVPITRAAEAAGVQPSLVWHWKNTHPRKEQDQ